MPSLYPLYRIKSDTFLAGGREKRLNSFYCANILIENENNLELKHIFLITTQFSSNFIAFKLLYNINIILFMDLTSLLMLLSQHLISQFSSNRSLEICLNYNFFSLYTFIRTYKFFKFIYHTFRT